MPVAAIVGGSLIGAGASIYGSRQAASSADRAARRSTDATLQMYNQNREDLAPYRAAGTGALGEIGDLYMGTDAERTAAMGRFETSPQYEFVRDEGLRGLENSASARGGALSGNAVRGATSFASNLASGEFNTYVDRLFGIAGIGQGATTTGVQDASNTGTQLANIYTNQGNARGSAYMAGAAGVNNAIQGGLQNWAFNTYLNRSAA